MAKKGKTGLFNRFLNLVEWLGNKLPHPITLFAILAVLVIIASAILSAANVTVENPTSPGETLGVKNLLSTEGIQYLFTSMVDNFINFAPLGVVLATMIGIGVAERSGFIGAGLRGIVTTVLNSLLQAALIFAGVLSSMAVDAGYVILPPLGALIFLSLNRHPLAGLAAAFAGVSAGFGANIFVTSLDPLLGSLTIEAAATVDPEYANTLNYLMNYYIMAVSVILLTVVGTIVTEKIVEPRLGEFKGQISKDEEITYLTKLEKKGLLYATLTTVVLIGIALLSVVPEWGPLRGDGGILNSPFMDSLVVILLFIFLIPGLVYGMVTKSIKNDRDAANQMSDTMASMGMFIVLAFAAGQFVAYFEETNIGLVLGAFGAELLESMQISGIPLVIGFMLLCAVINLFIGSASAKWAIMAPVFVPLMMDFNFSPALTQAAYRIADSTTNIITPTMTYFAMIIAFAQKYNKKIGIGTLVSMMLPYTIFFSIAWTLMLIIWMLLGIDLGPGAPIYYESE
ncbi:LOW QUALITY PROTEIN: aminobenzoyl-glutamate transport protein [Bacillus sp. JCM 19045]|nr:LOW QUALITY PROTEIN: aminobenzoyl-glutamate transport protein [Bacillus sp. JCM 19045]